MHYISPLAVVPQKLYEMATQQQPVGLSDESRAAVQRARTYLDVRMATADKPIYGINTGFGSLCDVRIAATEIEALQKNLVMSHACGTGDEVPADVVRLMLLLKVQSLAQGFSGVQVETCERLLFFYNNDILPIVYQQGSLGASGDLSPLAHLSLPLLGLGEVYYEGARMSGAAALERAGLSPLVLQSKEGLALLNGTQFSLAYSVYCTAEAQRLSAVADMCAALSADTWLCRSTPFDARLHAIRPHAGQVATAAKIRALLLGSPLNALEKTQVQDPYSFRCVPQVHGASKDTFTYVGTVVDCETNSVTDNPNIFVEDNEILSGGNFHAQPLALALDFLAIALAELGSISERRTYLLISGQRGLPTYLAPHAGLHSGLMIPQYTAASIVSQNKQLCTPASVDSIVSSNGQEDHVSMAANAATKCLRIVHNLENILAIEWLTATQALALRRPLQTAPCLEKVVAAYRNVVPFAEFDRVFSDDIRATVEFLRTADIV